MTDGRRFIDPASHNLSVFNTSITGDTGSYTCVASNSAGTSQYSVPVNFTDLMSEDSVTFVWLEIVANLKISITVNREYFV